MKTKKPSTPNQSKFGPGRWIFYGLGFVLFAAISVLMLVAVKDDVVSYSKLQRHEVTVYGRDANGCVGAGSKYNGSGGVNLLVRDTQRPAVYSLQCVDEHAFPSGTKTIVYTAGTPNDKYPAPAYLGKSGALYSAFKTFILLALVSSISVLLGRALIKRRAI